MVHFAKTFKLQTDRRLQNQRQRSLNPGKVTAMAICPIIVPFITQRALDV